MVEKLQQIVQAMREQNWLLALQLTLEVTSEVLKAFVPPQVRVATGNVNVEVLADQLELVYGAVGTERAVGNSWLLNLWPVLKAILQKLLEKV